MHSAFSGKILCFIGLCLYIPTVQAVNICFPSPHPPPPRLPLFKTSPLKGGNHA